MLSKLNVINRNQKGFTLIEIVVAIAISSIIVVAITSLTYETITINAKSTNHQIAISQVQNAVNSLSRDTAQAQIIIPRDSAGNPLQVNPSNTNQTLFDLKSSGHQLELKWVDWTNVTHDVTYKIDASGELDRFVSAGATTVVATNIGIASGNWDSYYKTLTFTIQAKVGTKTNLQSIESRTFQIIPRSVQ